MLLSAITSILGRGVIELLPAFADLVFRRGSVGLANLTTAAGIGAIAGALVLSHTGSRAIGPRLTQYSTVLLGPVVVAFGLCSSFALGLLVTAVFGFMIVLCSVGLQVTLQSGIHDRFRGRVLGMWSAVNVAGPGIGGGLAGWLAQLAGLKVVSVLTGLACLLLACWALLRTVPAGSGRSSES
jgi:MFS family permease